MYCPRPTPKSWFGCHDRDEEIASAALRLSRGILGIGKTLNSGTRGLFRARAAHQQHIFEALNKTVPLPVLMMRGSGVCTDYGPRVRDIVAGEDMQEALTMQREKTGRTTRNSGGAYVRCLKLTDAARMALDGTGLDIEAGTR